MNKEQQEKLKRLAKETIALELGLTKKAVNESEFEDELFHEERGVFVTLEKNGQLRGCIGNIEPVYTLFEAVKSNAKSAAFGDPRFSPLTKAEFGEVEIEISVLTKPVELKFDSPEELLHKLKQGTDGVVIEQGFYKATYLPQVWEDLPDKEEFLSSLCMKAGLSPDAWREEDIKVYIYQVEKF